jgi:hypothetical protein
MRGYSYARVLTQDGGSKGLMMKCRSFPVLVIAAFLAGCSAYHGARESLPADAGQRLTLRIDDARAAERAAEESALDLLSRWRSGAAPEDVDRLDVRSRDLARRVLAAEDVPAAGQGSDLAEVQRLRSRADRLRDVVASIRAGEDSARDSLNEWLSYLTGTRGKKKAAALGPRLGRIV